MREVFNCSYFFHKYESAFALVIFIFFVALVFRRYGSSFRVRLMSGISFVLVLIGSLLNLRERLATGCVYDYIGFFDLLSFNLYDVLVVSGFVILGLCLWKINSK